MSKVIVGKNDLQSMSHFALTSSGVLSGRRLQPDDTFRVVDALVTTSTGDSLNTPGDLAVMPSCRKAVSSKSLPTPFGTFW